MRKLLLMLLIGTALAAKIPSLNVEQPKTSGLASWYGTFHQGRRMANGQIFDRMKYTCASRTYRLGTILMVSLPQRGTFVLVRVTDLGPYRHPGRILDLSEKAAATLGIKDKGLAYVEITPAKGYR